MIRTLLLFAGVLVAIAYIFWTDMRCTGSTYAYCGLGETVWAGLLLVVVLFLAAASLHAHWHACRNASRIKSLLDS